MCATYYMCHLMDETRESCPASPASCCREPGLVFCLSKIIWVLAMKKCHRSASVLHSQNNIVVLSYTVNAVHWRKSLNRNREDDCQCVHDEALRPITHTISKILAQGAVIIYGWGGGRCKSENRAHSKFAPPLDDREKIWGGWLGGWGIREIIALKLLRNLYKINGWSLITFGGAQWSY